MRLQMLSKLEPAQLSTNTKNSQALCIHWSKVQVAHHHIDFVPDFDAPQFLKMEFILPNCNEWITHMVLKNLDPLNRIKKYSKGQREL